MSNTDQRIRPIGRCDRCGDTDEELYKMAIEDNGSGMLDRTICRECFDDASDWWDEGW